MTTSEIENKLIELDFKFDENSYVKELNEPSKDRFLHEVEVLKKDIKDDEISVRIYVAKSQGWRTVDELTLIENLNGLATVARLEWLAFKKVFEDAGVKVKVITNLL